MKTTRELKVRFRDMHDIVIPAGTPAHWIKGGAGGYAVEASRVDLISDTHSLFKHDSTHYYIWVDRAEIDLKNPQPLET